MLFTILISLDLEFFPKIIALNTFQLFQKQILLFYKLVSKIAMGQVADQKIFKKYLQVTTYHWSKFQLNRSSTSSVIAF